MAQTNPIILHHPRERLPMLAPKILEIDSNINVMYGRFFITKEDFEVRVNQICFCLWKIHAFAKFAIDSFHKIKDRHLMCGDTEIFVEFLYIFLRKYFVDPKGMFRKVCRQYPFEFLILFDLCREKKC